MVEHQLPKLMTGVRFPSPAPKKAARPIGRVSFFAEDGGRESRRRYGEKRKMACAPGKRKELAERRRMYDHPIPLSRPKKSSPADGRVSFFAEDGGREPRRRYGEKRKMACAPGKRKELAERGRMYDRPIPLSRSKEKTAPDSHLI